VRFNPNKMTVKRLVKDIGPISEFATAKQWEQILKRVWLKGTEEDAKLFLSTTFNYMKARCKYAPHSQVTIFGGERTRSIVAATNRAAETIAKAWKGNKRKGVK
jgi:hypothetical protein